MATRTSIGSGLWSAAGTWDTGVPVDGDDVIISSGDTVTFDVDQSAWSTGLTGIVITGTLEISTSTGSYWMMLAGVISGAGDFNCGSSGTPYPTDCQFDLEILTSTSYYINGSGGLTVNFYGQRLATNPYVRLTADASAGATVLSVDTDVTTDWTDGDTIQICEYYTGQQETDPRIIATSGITSTTITVTSGLTRDKKEGSYLIVLKHNLIIHATYSSYQYVFRECDNSHFGTAFVVEAGDYRSSYSYQCDSCEYDMLALGNIVADNKWPQYLLRDCNHASITGIIAGMQYVAYYNSDNIEFDSDTLIAACAYIASSCAGIVFDGVSVGVASAFNSCSDITMSGSIYKGQTQINACRNSLISGILDGGTGLMSSCTGVVVSGTLKNATSSGGAMAGCSNFVLTGTVQDNYYGLTSCSNFTIAGATFSGNTNGDLYRCYFSRLIDGVLYSSIENTGYNDTSYASEWSYIPSYNHDGVEGAFKAWTSGGIIASQTSSPPTGYDVYYTHYCENADRQCFREYEYTMKPDEVLKINALVRIENGADVSSFPPRLMIIDPSADPIQLPGESALAEDQVTTTTGDGTTWQELYVSYNNASTAEKIVKVRITCKHATADIDEVWDIEDVKSVVDAIKLVTDKLDTMLTPGLDPTNSKFTGDALSMASNAGSTADATATVLNDMIELAGFPILYPRFKDTALEQAPETDISGITDVTDKLGEMIESGGEGDYRFDTIALEQAPATDVSSIQAVTDKLDTTLEDAGGGLSKFTEDALSNGPGGEFNGEGSVIVDWNYNGGDYRYLTGVGGVGINNASIYAYLKNDYDNNRREAQYIVGQTWTNVDGEWRHPLNMDPGDYTLYYFKRGQYGPDTQEVTVS